MRAANRVAFNTAITYGRAVFTSIISLYATRLVLNALGAEDFGLYNVIGGMIAMLAFLNAAMTTSTQRFMSFSLGSKSSNDTKSIFANSVILHILIGVFLVGGIVLVGDFLIDSKLKIDPSRIEVAKYILYFVVASTFITVVSVPYDAVINAHENMSFLAAVSIFESVIKLVIAISISYIHVDRLVFYGLLMMVLTVIVRIVKRTYSKRRYEECNVILWEEYNQARIRELTSFAGWQLFGTLCALGRNQGVAVVLNLFYGTVVNAAYGVANQINGQIMFFSQTLMSAMRPQIMKSEGANDRNRMIRLALTANRFSFYLFTFFAIPLFFQMPFFLQLWLKNVPTYAVEFCRAIILLTMMSQINQGVMTAFQAIGRIRLYQTVAGGIQLLTLPIGFLLLSYGYPPHYIILASFGLESVSTIFRIYYFNYLTGYPVKVYFKEVVFKSFLSVILISLAVYFLQINLDPGPINSLVICCFSMIVYGLVIYFVGFDLNDKILMDRFRITLLDKIKKRHVNDRIIK